MPPRSLALLPAALAGALLLTPAAHAAVLPGQTIDGPSADIKSAQDVSLAGDGSGAFAYLKDTTQDQVFVARRSGGAWGSGTVATDSLQDISEAQVEASSGGRLLLVYRKATGDLEARVSPGPGQPFGAALPVTTNVSAFDSDANDAGVGYIVASTNGGDVTTFRVSGNTVTPQGANLNGAGNNSGGPGNVGISVTGAGNAVAAWKEDVGGTSKVFASRLTGTTAGAAVEATVATLGGANRATGAQNVDVESDAAGNAWVAFREQFTYAVVNDRNRPLVRRLSGGTFGAALLVDPGPTPPGALTDAEFTRLAVSPDGGQALASGFVQNANTNKPPLFGAALTPGGASPFALEPAPSDGPIRSGNGVVNGGTGFIAYSYQPSGSANYIVRARLRQGTGTFAPPIAVSNNALGSVDGATTPLTSIDATGTGAVAYGQGAAAQKRVLVATLDPLRAGGGGTGGGGTTKDTKKPTLSNVKLSRKTFAVGKASTPIVAAVERGTTIRYSLSEPGKVSLKIERKLKGRKVGKKCRKPTRKNRAKRKCNRYKRAGTLRRTGKTGANSVAFSGRIGKKALKPASYRLTITATDSAGNKSKATRASFRIVRVKKAKKKG